MKLFLRFWIRLLLRFRAYNTAVLDTPGPVLLLPNHVSWWDWALIGICLDDDWRFVTSSTVAESHWLLRLVMVNRRTFPVDMTSPYAVKHMAEYLQKGGRLVLFPEGRMSRTGSLMKLFDGTGFLISRTHAKVIIAYIRGANRLPHSPNPDEKQWFPHVSAHFSDVLTPPQSAHTNVTEMRARITEWLRHQMVEQRFKIEMEFGPRTVPEGIRDTAQQCPGRVILQDATMQKLTYRRLMVGAAVLAQQWQRRVGTGPERVGVLLPNVVAMPVTTLSLWSANKIPAILNYTMGTPVMLACARLAGLKHVITSRVFVERAKLDVAPFTDSGIELIYLEDVRTGIGGAKKLVVLLRQILFPRSAFRVGQKAEDTAVVLFTSGSEGEPKGVELTHANLVANIQQMLSIVDLMDTDRFFNALPLFHSFGLTVGLLLPLIRGVFVLLYLSPLHYRVVPSAFYNLDCTVFFGTNTFLTGYARKAHPYDFRTLRYLFAGAEKVQEATVTRWVRKFGVRIIEGYGATECSPCLSANMPMRARHGSAGQFLPGIEHRVEPVEGVADGGRLLVRGPNVMRGYLNPEANAKFKALGGWYDTGDVVKVDDDGFLFILGRLKRFAKISGEMVSLTAVEEALSSSFPQFGHKFGVAVVAKSDDTKGERLVAVTNESKLTMDAVRDAVRARGLGNLAVPRELKVIPELPRLGTGKVDYRELDRIVMRDA